MRTPKPVLLPWVAAVLLSSPACIEVPGITDVRGEVRLRTPEATTYTKGVLDISLEVTGHPPDRVELLWDGEVLAVLESPYTYALDTTGVAEGEHRLGAQLVFGETVLEGEERLVVVDRTAPRVVSRSPEPGAANVWVKDSFQAVFSEPMQASSVTSTSVRLMVENAETTRTVLLSADRKTMTVAPAAPISAPASAAITLTSVLTDLAGNALEVPTGAWNWEHPKVRFEISGPIFEKDSGSIHAQRYAFGSDRQGHAFIIQAENFLTYGQLRVYSNAGSDWAELGRGLEARPTGFEPNQPTLRFDPGDGSPVVAWHEGNGSNEDERVYVARWTGAQWRYLGGPTGIVPEHPSSLYPVMNLDAVGNPLVAFFSDTENTTYVYRWTGMTWESIGGSLTAPVEWDSSRPMGVVASPSSNTVFVALLGTKDDVPKLALAQWDGTEWKTLRGTQPPVELPVGVPPSRDFGLFITPDGRPLLTWLEQSNPGSATARSYVWMNGEWSHHCPPLNPSSERHSQLSRLEVDPTGVMWMLWAKDGTPGFHIEQCSGEGWSHFASSSTAPHPIPTAVLTTSSLAQHTNGLHVLTTLSSGGVQAVHVHPNR
ncbi:Ig-like domain-containing protein [Myxococcus fulvus]|uniref:Ig-like domain-containing protein n=1 Tax=Myxococcus fulvus TaxID=33 RepID=UPI003B9BE78F